MTSTLLSTTGSSAPDVEPAATASSKLTLNASYNPPLGKLGRLIDRAVMYRLAQITMNDFTTRLAESLSAQLELGISPRD